MATQLEIELIAKTDKAEKEITELIKRLEDLEKQNKELIDQNKKVEKSSKGVSKSFKAIGKAFKAIGIGIVVALFAKLGDALSKNQKAVDFFSTGLEALGIAFSDLFDYIFNNAGTVVNFFKDIFENPKESIKDLGVAIKKNIIERFVSLLKVSGLLGNALLKLFKGDFQGAMDSAKDASIEFVDVLTGVDDSASKIKNGINSVVESVVDYTNKTVELAKSNVQLKNTAELAVASQARLVEQFDRQAEIQRQIRDEERNSIKDRIKANNELGRVLEEQEKAMLKQADLQVAAAQAALNTNNNIENQVALIDALANKEGVLAQVEGFRSEQLVNDLALKREQIELDQTITDAEKQRQLDQLAFEESQLKDPLSKLDKQREINDAEFQLAKEDLERKRLLFEEGTQARVEAEQAFLDSKQEFSNKAIDIEKNEREQKLQIKLKAVDDLISIADTETGVGKALLIAKNVLLAKELVLEASKTLGFATQAGARSTIALAEGTAKTAAVGFPQNIPLLIGYAAQAAVIFGTIKKAIKGSKSSIPSLGDTGGGGGGRQAPTFNTVGTSGVNQIAQSLQKDNAPIKAVVVGSEVTTQQAADRNIVNTATIG